MNPVKVSVIVPAYNVEDYIARCIDSLLAQSLSEIEIVAVDDGSTDRTGEILDAYQNKYPNQMKVFHVANQGVSPARNYGIRKSSGKYLAFVDSDDWVEPDTYRCMYQTIEETASDLVFCDVMKVFEDGSRERVTSLDKEEGVISVAAYLKDGRYIQLACNKLFPRKIWTRYSFENKYFEDLALIPQIVSDCKKIAYVKQPFYCYYRRTDSISTTYMKDVYQYKIKSYQSAIRNVNPAYQYEVTFWIVQNILDCMKRKELAFFREDLKKALKMVYEEAVAGKTSERWLELKDLCQDQLQG